MTKRTSIILPLLLFGMILFAEDGSKLWLRFKDKPQVIFSSIHGDASKTAVSEFHRVWEEMGNNPIPSSDSKGDNILIIGRSNEKLVRRLIPKREFSNLSDEGFIIKTILKDGITNTVVGAKTDAGLLYGVFHLLRLIQTGSSVSNLNIRENPSYDRRILNHWDNLDRTVERGYAGYSIWRWDELPQNVSERYSEYARANASIGINGTVLNNVNATPEILTLD